jgi:apolipoprotein D and lipocalin family protein
MGTWHEVARYPTDFEDSREKHCIDVVSILTIREPNRFSIHDSCRNQKANGKLIAIDGQGRAPTAGTAKLRVSFQWPFYADYWIIGLDPDYRWAVVTAPSRRYLWILSRQPTLAADDYNRAVAIAAQEHFDVGKLVKTGQSM